MAWGVYKNGNSICKINLENGTKIRETEDDEFILEFPESLDVSITEKCDGLCPFCYQGCTPNGANADVMGAKFIDTLHPYTEIALQTNMLDHPDLIPFLEKLKERKLIPSITINQRHFEQKEELVAELINKKLIYGVGISLVKPTRSFIRRVHKYPNAVIHVINGIFSGSDIEALRDQDLKILILGYKDLGRGVDYKDSNSSLVTQRQRYLYDVLRTLPAHFKVLSFDNLALEQLNVKRILSSEKWAECYMGDEGSSSMYIDLVNKRFGVSSLCKPEEMHPLMDNIKDMFDVVKKEARNKYGEKRV